MIEFFVLFLTVLLLYIIWNGRYWKRMGVESPTPLPFVGNMLNYCLARKHYAEAYEDIYKAYPKAAYVGIYRLMNEPAILVRDLEVVKDVFIRDFNSFHDNHLNIDKKLDPLTRINPFIAEGERWRDVRSQMGQLFTPSKVKNAVPTILKVCSGFEKYIEREMGKNVEAFEAKNICAKYTIEVISSAGFGLEAQAFTNSNSYFSKYCQSIFSPQPWSYLHTIGIHFLMPVSKYLKLPYIPQEIQDWLATVMNELLARRKEEKERRNDLLEVILNSKESDGQTISTETIFGHCATLLLEGFETSSTTMAYSLYELACNPEAQRKVQREIDEIFTKYEGNLTYEALLEMKYLESVLLETLRLHPTMPATIKRCTENTTLAPQYPGAKPVTIPAGTIAVVPVLAIHNDPEIYPDPQKFDPDRFSEDAQKTRNKCAFLAFGEGPRICIGMRFGLAQSKAGLATILRKYNIRLSPKTEIPLRMVATTFLINAVGGIWIKFEARNKS